MLILRYRGIQKVLLSIEHTSLEIKQGQLGMHRQVHRRQVGYAGLRLFAIKLNAVAYASPDVDLVRQFERNLKVVVADAIERRAMRLSVGGRSVAGCNRIRGQSWKVIGPVIAENCTSLGILGFRRLQVLVGDVDLSFESIELRILKNLPPVAAEILVIRLGRFPIANLLISWRNLCCGAPIFRSNCASGHVERSYREQNHPTRGLAPARN